VSFLRFVLLILCLNYSFTSRSEVSIDSIKERPLDESTCRTLSAGTSFASFIFSLYAGGVVLYHLKDKKDGMKQGKFVFGPVITSLTSLFFSFHPRQPLMFSNVVSVADMFMHALVAKKAGDVLNAHKVNKLKVFKSYIRYGTVAGLNLLRNIGCLIYIR
jgi:hypothetical protein